MRRHLNRREFLAATAAGLAVSTRRLRAQSGPLRLTAVGQSLILRDLAGQANSGYAAIRGRLALADVCVSNLEAAIRGASARDARPPAASGGVIAGPTVLDSLRRTSINLLPLASNHAYDLGDAGVLSTIDEVRRRGFGFAGTGSTLDAASQPGYFDTPKGPVALVAMASGALPASAIAADAHAGVNHVAVRDDQVNPADADRILAAVRVAAARASTVVVYQHDHYWAPDWHDTPDWKKHWCRACIDAGATTFVSHGVPFLHGIEIYKSRPIFYGLGNFVFHAAQHFPGGNIPQQYVQPECWQSVIAECQFEGGVLRALHLDAIALTSDDGGTGRGALTGDPRLATPLEAKPILEHLRDLSMPLGTEIEIQGLTARVKLTP